MELNLASLEAGTDYNHMLIDFSHWLPVLSSKLNLLPQDIIIPDDEVFAKMAIEAVRMQGAPALHVIMAKMKNIFQGVEEVLLHEICSVIIGMALTVAECLHYWKAYSLSGRSPYEFSQFYDDNNVLLKRVNTIGDFNGI